MLGARSSQPLSLSSIRNRDLFLLRGRGHNKDATRERGGQTRIVRGPSGRGIARIRQWAGADAAISGALRHRYGGAPHGLAWPVGLDTAPRGPRILQSEPSHVGRATTSSRSFERFWRGTTQKVPPSAL